MAELIAIDHKLGKEKKYKSLLPQIEALLSGENNLIANMANMAAALHDAFNFFWVGFYLVDGDELILGPFQGPVACTRIHYGKGVCGTSWEKKQPLMVPDVDKFPGHISCNAASRSEIVIPGIENDRVSFLLDVDSDKLDAFDEIDKEYLEKLIRMLGIHNG